MYLELNECLVTNEDLKAGFIFKCTDMDMVRPKYQKGLNELRRELLKEEDRALVELGFPSEVNLTNRNNDRYDAYVSNTTMAQVKELYIIDDSTDEPVATLLYRRELSDSFTFKLKYLYVARNYRKQGLGTYLVAQAFKLAKKDRAKRINVSVIVSNKAAIKLYAKFGFKAFYMGEAAIL